MYYELLRLLQVSPTSQVHHQSVRVNRLWHHRRKRKTSRVSFHRQRLSNFRNDSIHSLSSCSHPSCTKISFVCSPTVFALCNFRCNHHSWHQISWHRRRFRTLYRCRCGELVNQWASRRDSGANWANRRCKHHACTNARSHANNFYIYVYIYVYKTDEKKKCTERVFVTWYVSVYWRTFETHALKEKVVTWSGELFVRN